ncbi:MAG: hypothetical protein JKY07_12090, partial [SAR324 cluster bacterium]|nr:hypothetical protein [SAR324 cluster bacterium]
VALREKTVINIIDFMQEVENKVAYLDSARPTAVNLKWALNRMLPPHQLPVRLVPLIV